MWNLPSRPKFYDNVVDAKTKSGRLEKKVVFGKHSVQLGLFAVDGMDVSACVGKEYWPYPLAVVVLGVLCGIHYIANIVRIGSIYFAVRSQPYVCEHVSPRMSIVHDIKGGGLNKLGISWGIFRQRVKELQVLARSWFFTTWIPKIVVFKPSKTSIFVFWLWHTFLKSVLVTSCPTSNKKNAIFLGRGHGFRSIFIFLPNLFG